MRFDYQAYYQTPVLPAVVSLMRIRGALDIFLEGGIGTSNKRASFYDRFNEDLNCNNNESLRGWAIKFK